MTMKTKELLRFKREVKNAAGMQVANLLEAYEDVLSPKQMRCDAQMAATGPDKRLVTGQVYAPGTIDTYGHFMTADELERVAHDFLANGLQASIDVQHDNKLIDAVMVESWINRGHPGFEEGAWVGTTKINDRRVWQMVKDGSINAYSFEILTFKTPVTVEIEYQAVYYGFTDPHPADGHRHAFLVIMGEDGLMKTGQTSKHPVDGHWHRISNASVTNVVDGHRHRYHLES